MGNKIQIVASAKDEVSGPLAKMRDQFDTLGKNKGFQAVAQGVGIGVGISALGLLSSGIGKVTELLGDSVKAALEEEASIQKLGSSLRANIPDWDGNTKAIESVIKARMDLGFSDEEQRQSLGLLVAATHDATKALEIQRTAMDLARFKGISLADATDALTKVEAGSYRILKSLGIVLKDGATQQDALNAVQKVASGQAEDYANTTGGKLLIAQTKMNETMEKAGLKILPVLSEALSGAADAADRLNNFIEALNGNLPSSEEDQRGWSRALMDFNPIAWSTGVALNNMNEEQKKLFLEAFKTRWAGKMKDDAVIVTGAMQDVTADVHIAAKAVQVLPNKMAGDLRGGWDAVHSAAVALGEAMKKPIKEAAREKALMDILTGKGSLGHLLTKGLKSADPLAKEAARKLYADTIAELDAFRDFRIVVSAVIGGGAGRGGGQGPHSPPTRAPAPGKRPSSSGGGSSPGGGGAPGTPMVANLYLDGKVLARAVFKEETFVRGLGTFSPG